MSHTELFSCIGVDAVVTLELKSHCCKQKVVVFGDIGTSHCLHILVRRRVVRRRVVRRRVVRRRAVRRRAVGSLLFVLLCVLRY